MKREKKLGGSSRSVPTKTRASNIDVAAQRQHDPRNVTEEKTIPPKRLSFKQRRDMVKEKSQDKSENEKTQQNIDTLQQKKPRPPKAINSAPPTSLSARRNAKPRQADDDSLDSKLQDLQQDVSSLNTSYTDEQKKARRESMLRNKANLYSAAEGDIVQEADEYESEVEESSSSEGEDLDLEQKLQLAEQKLLQDTTMTSANVTTANVTMEETQKWQLQPLIEMAQEVGCYNTIVDFDSVGDRLFLMFTNMSLVEISIKSKQLVQEINLTELDGIDFNFGEEQKVSAFAIISDLNLIAFSTSEAVYLVDFESEFKFSTKIDTTNVVFISYVDIYIVLMQASDEDSSEAILTCRMLYGAEEGNISIKRFMGQQVKVRTATNSVVFSCGSQIGRVSIPEMELMYQEDTQHTGEILDFEVSATCIFTT